MFVRMTVAAALVLPLVGFAPAAATAEPPAEATVTTVQLSVGPDRSPAGGDKVLAAELVAGERVTSDVLETGGFQSVGLTWAEGAGAGDLDALVRTRANGAWSDWQTLAPSDSGPDAGTPDASRQSRDGTDPMWFGDADAVQVSYDSGSAAAGDLRLSMVDVPEATSSTPAGLAPLAPAATTTTGSVTTAVQTGPAPPLITTREEWGARPQVCQPNIADSLVGAVVHHTAGPNTYATVAEAERQIRADQAYHIDARGWCDIGYNFVVDKWGNIYEGRADSLTSAVVGVHAGGFNTGTVGVSMLGSYDAVPPAAVQNAVALILGFRLAAFGARPDSPIAYHTMGGENSSIPPDTTIGLPRIWGHRDVAYTACPGNGGYAALPAIRAGAQAVYDLYYSARLQAESRSVVTALYHDLLDRSPEAGGLSAWTGTLVSGVSQDALVLSLTASDEYISKRVAQAYRAVLDRDPDSAGAAAWLAAVRAGQATVDDAQRRFYDSAEYYAISGGTTEGYIRLLYQTVLGRSARDSEVANWSTVFADRGRAVVVDAIWFSTEAASRRAGTYYQTFLGRAPDPSGQAAWAQVLLGYGEGAVRAGIAGSQEYRARAIARYP